MNGNLTLIVIEDKENRQRIEMKKIVYGYINDATNDDMLVENLSMKDILVNTKSNDSISITNVNKYGDKDSRLEIDSKHTIIRENIETASADLKVYTTAPQSEKHTTDNMIDIGRPKDKSKSNEHIYDIHIYTFTFNSESEGSDAPDINNICINKGSDKIDINTTMLVKEDNERKTIVEIGKIFDEDINGESNKVTLI